MPKEVTHRPVDQIEVEVEVADNEPDGKIRVMVQLPFGWMTIPPDDARMFAGMLLEAATEADRQIAKKKAGKSRG